MSAAVQRTLLAAALVASGLAAGFFYAYEVSVTRGTALVADASYVETMNAINATVRNAPFFAVFFGALILGLLAALARLGRPRDPVTWIVAASVLLYAGAFLVTAAFNVPLNEELAARGAGSAGELAAARDDYEADWNRYNLVRTLLSMAAFVGLAAAAMLDRRGTRKGDEAPAGVPYTPARA
jgi:uncharacterized membrane protein